jgi:HTH-type transcriptional regulator, transcriptional repressor of NAD biosynthesis genes
VAGAASRSHGLVLGKFLPPHAGHLFLIDQARQRVDELTVLVCSLQREPIPGAVRVEWMRELLRDAPNVRIVHVADENPTEPHEHPDFWPIWIATIRRATPKPIDVVFTSEAYGDALARRLDARHELIDLARSTIPVSGSAILADPNAHWRWIPGVVRPWFVRRVAITGSESTGKTTLARRLAEHYGTIWTPEFGRVYLDRKAAALDASDVEPIARGQMATEEEGARASPRDLLILDTDLLSTDVYASHYYGMSPAWLREAVRTRSADLYLLADIDVPWVPDPQRDRPHMREHMHELFRATVEGTGKPFVVLQGDWDARFRQAVEAIDSFMQAR